MNIFENGEIRIDVIREVRALASNGADVPELVDHLRCRLELQRGNGVLATMAYFRSAFALTLREALPLREWIGGRDRSEVDSILIPAMERTRSRWQTREPVQTGP